MATAHDPVATIRKEIETWNSPLVELDCFGSDNAEQIVSIVNEFCRTYLRSGVRGHVFYRASVGSAHGIQHEDGRNIVIKVRRSPERIRYLLRTEGEALLRDAIE